MDQTALSDERSIQNQATASFSPFGRRRVAYDDVQQYLSLVATYTALPLLTSHGMYPLAALQHSASTGVLPAVTLLMKPPYGVHIHP